MITPTAPVAGQNMFNVMHTGQKARLLVADGLGIVPALRRSIDIWLAIDVGASLSLAATAIQWSAVVVALDALSSTTATRSYSGDSLGTDTAATQLQLRAALQVYATFKVRIRHAECLHVLGDRIRGCILCSARVPYALSACAAVMCCGQATRFDILAFHHTTRAS